MFVCFGSGLSEFTPAEVKAKLGKVKKLSDLKARIQELNKDKKFRNTGEGLRTPTKVSHNDIESTRRQLFSPPKLSKEEVTIVDLLQFEILLGQLRAVFF